MKILVITQYFWPENFRINDLVIGLTERGHHVEILTGKPNYPNGNFYQGYSFFSKRTESWNGMKVHRSPLIPRGYSGGARLMLNYISFAFFSTLRGLGIAGDFDRILVYEPSPITVGLPAIALKFRKKANIYFWVQDLWPQSVTAAGGVKNKIVIGLLNSITKWIYKKSHKILIQSEAFRNILLKQEVINDKIIYYPNSVEEFFKVKDTNAEILKKMPIGFKIMFAGNIGESQDFETIVEAARIVSESNKDIKWVILGDGRKKSYLEDKIKELRLENHIFLLGSYPVVEMPDFFACADCLLVSLKRDYIFSLTIPSKIQSYLACGKPILASLDGEGSRIILEAKAGIAVEAENPLLLATKALNFYNLSEMERVDMGKNARTYFENNFERELLIDRLEEIFSYE
jgi:glycosyltransferase involved in cell wall biosynthesis